MTGPLVVFDVDGVTHGGKDTERPGIRFTLDVLKALGCDVHLWSSAGVGRALRAGWSLGLDGLVCHGKPARPINPTEAAAIFGRTPDLIVDNDPNHLVDGWNGLLVTSWWGPQKETA